MQYSENDGETIQSDRMSVISARIHCWQCREEIDAIALYSEAPTLQGEPLEDCTFLHITEIDDVLKERLAPWPFFKEDNGLFCNQCPHCEAPQRDIALHCEPGGPFYRMNSEKRRTMTLIPLTGSVRLKGEQIFRG